MFQGTMAESTDVIHYKNWEEITKLVLLEREYLATYFLKFCLENLKEV